MATLKEIKQEEKRRQEKKKSTSRSTVVFKSSKTNFLVNLRPPKGFPRDAQETPKTKGFQDASKSTKSDFKRAPKRCQDHHWM